VVRKDVSASVCSRDNSVRILSRKSDANIGLGNEIFLCGQISFARMHVQFSAAFYQSLQSVDLRAGCANVT